jgi:hypothetical protein
VRRRAQELQQWLQSPRLWREPCHDAIARLGPEAVLAQLDAWGDERFAGRAEALAQQIAALGPGRALFQSLLEVLGYGGNTPLMQEIAARVDWRALRARLAHAATAQEIEALLVASAGTLLDGHTGRPANHPARRLAGLAALLSSHRALFGDAPDIARIASLPARDQIAAFSVAPLIGRSRAVELLTNAVLPWAAALAPRLEQPDIEMLALRSYAALPRPSAYGALAFLEQNLRSGGKPLALTARRQQGLLALYKAECTQGGCGRCRFS